MASAAQTTTTLASRLALVLVLAAVSTSVAGCTEDGSDSDRRAATVMVDVFSGRPNPEFTLSPEATGQLEEILAELVTADVEPPAFDLLGFRRFRVSSVRYDGSASGVSITPDLVVLDRPLTVLTDPEGSAFSLMRSEAEEELSSTDFGAIPQRGRDEAHP